MQIDSDEGGHVCQNADSGKHGMTESSAEGSAELFSEMVPNGLNIPMYES